MTSYSENLKARLWGRDLEEDLISFMKRSEGLFPGIFTLGAAAMFGSPVMTGLSMAHDTSVRYWIGTFAWVVIIIPILLLGCHLVHHYHGRPRFIPVLLSTCVPALIIICVGYVHSAPIGNVSNRLFSTDCTTYQEKFHLETAHAVAQRLLNTCIGRVSMEMNITVRQASHIIELRDCSEYQNYHNPGGGSETLGNWQREWAFLESLEGELSCSGWCYPSRTLWGPNIVMRDLCTNTAAVVLESRVNHWASRMFTVGVLQLILSAGAIFTIQEILNRMGKGDDW